MVLVILLVYGYLRAFRACQLSTGFSAASHRPPSHVRAPVRRAHARPLRLPYLFYQYARVVTVGSNQHWQLFFIVACVRTTAWSSPLDPAGFKIPYRVQLRRVQRLNYRIQLRSTMLILTIEFYYYGYFNVTVYPFLVKSIPLIVHLYD